MKRSAWLLMLAIIVLAVTLSVSVVSSPSTLLGDVDQNEYLSSADIRLMLRYLVGDKPSLTAQERLLADCDGNNRVDTLDVRYILSVLTLDLTQSTVTTTTTTVATTTTTQPSLDDEGFYDEIVKP